MAGSRTVFKQSQAVEDRHPFISNNKSTKLVWPSVALIALLCGRQTLAQMSFSPAISTLPDIVVTAETPPVPALMKTTQSIKDTPQSVTIIDSERMVQQNLQTLQDVLQQTPGITVQPYQFLTTGYYARGFKIDSFQQDGVPILMGQMASPPEDMAMYERVEILRGANGLLQGTGNPAATVNLVPKRAPRNTRAHAALSAGSWNRNRGEVDIGSALNDRKTLRGRLVASHEDRGFFYDVARQKSTHLYGTFEIDLDPASLLRAGVQHQRIRSITNMAGVPFYRDGSDIDLPVSTYLDVDWDRFDWDNTRIFAGLEHTFANGWTAKVNLNRLSGEARLKYAGANGAVDPLAGSRMRLMGAAYRFDNRQFSADGYLSGAFSLFGRRHEALIGANFQRTRAEQFSADFVMPVNVSVDPWNWDPHSVPEPDTGPFRSRGPTRVTQSGIYAMSRFSLADRIKLIAGARVSQWKQNTSTNTARLRNELTPYGGLVIDITPQWAVYASYAQVFQPQIQTTWQGSMLDPVKGTNREIGIKGELLDGRLNASLALFNIRQRNRAQTDPAHPCIGAICYYIASGEVESRGIEAEISGQPLTGWELAASYTYNTTRYLKDAQAQGQAFARFTPKHIFRFWTNYILPWNSGRASASLGIQAQSRYSVSSGGATLRQGGYALAHMRIGYRISSRLTAALHVNNLFNRRYYQSLSGPYWNNRYGEPRNVALTLRAEY